ncbi:glycosyltransferase family 2 protein [Nocardioides korecus]
MEVGLSVVIPMYDEAEVLDLLVERLRPVLDGLGTAYEVVAVDDGSRDLTAAGLERHRRTWGELRVVRLRANAGHQAALSAGLRRCRGDFVVTLDADLQDPPEVIPRMLELARRDALDVVYGERADRSTDSRFKRWSARAFYALIRRIAQTGAEGDVGDFRLMSRATVDAVNTMPDHARVLRFVVPALGFPSGRVPYRREVRAAGTSKYPLLTMVRLSLDSVTGSSVVPLRVATLAGLLSGVLAALLMVYVVAALVRGDSVAGWASTVLIVCGVGAVQLVSLGIMGEYVGRMYTHLQGRPAYFVAHDSLDATCVHEPAAPPTAAPALAVGVRGR